MPLLLNQKKIHFQNRPILFIDLEMSGLEANEHEIVECAALVVRREDLSIIKSYYTKVKPQHLETADKQALKIINYNPNDWQNAISLRQMLLDLAELAPNCILAGWSIQNEWDFLLTALKKEDLEIFFDYHLLEIWSIVYNKFRNAPDIPKLNLEYTCKLLGITVNRHKPDSDIRATYEIFKKLSGL